MTTPTEQKFMIDCIVTDISLYLMRDYGVSEEKALATIYNSNYYLRLSDTSTGFFVESSAYNYSYLRKELEGKE